MIRWGIYSGILSLGDAAIFLNVIERGSPPVPEVFVSTNDPLILIGDRPRPKEDVLLARDPFAPEGGS